MIRKKFLAPILVLVGFGLTARGATLAYCDSGCGTNTSAAFNAIVAADNYTYASPSDITFTGTLLSSTEYEDALTLTQFFDTEVNGAFNNTNISGVLETLNGNVDTVQITIPATYSAIVLSISSLNGSGTFCVDGGCDYVVAPSGTPTFLAYTNDPGAVSWTVTISAMTGSPQLAINGFDVASADLGNSDTPEVSTLLLIGTGLIAMRWTRRVPRRWFGKPRLA